MPSEVSDGEEGHQQAARGKREGNGPKGQSNTSDVIKSKLHRMRWMFSGFIRPFPVPYCHSLAIIIGWLPTHIIKARWDEMGATMVVALWWRHWISFATIRQSHYSSSSSPPLLAWHGHQPASQPSKSSHCPYSGRRGDVRPPTDSVTTRYKGFPLTALESNYHDVMKQ